MITLSPTILAAAEKDYLTEQEVRSISFENLNTIYQDVKGSISHYTEHEFNLLVTQKIRDFLEIEQDTILPLGYELPGGLRITQAEVNLAKSNPGEFTIYGSTALAAINLSEAIYNSGLSQGNGDAFRHAYWNAILVQEFGAVTRGPAYGVERAEIWTTAHESESSGIDKEMDLYNNYVGREIGYFNYTQSRTHISNTLQTLVNQGTLVRIVNNRLVATDSTK